MQSTNAEITHLADQIDRSFHGGAWHGPGTREALVGIDAATAGRRSTGSPHTIADLVRHITFWLDAAHVRIIEGADVDADADWPQESELTDEVWNRMTAELEEAHAKLHSALLRLKDSRLDDPVSGSDPTVRGLLLGTLQHNAYHTGQIVEIARRSVA